MVKKIVDYFEYCHKCRYRELAENEDPCWDCLTTPVNDDTHRPVEFVKAEEIPQKNLWYRQRNILVISPKN